MDIIHSPIAKISRPITSGVVPRSRVFALLESVSSQPIVWISAPAGSGKTTLVTSWLDEGSLPCLWYQLDEGDSDPSTFFYYLGLAARKAVPGIETSLPLLTPEYLPGLTTFVRRYFENLYCRLQPPFVLVFDDYQNVPARSQFHEIMRIGLSVLPLEIRIAIISRSDPPPEFARLRASNRMSFVGWQDIQFDFEETISLIQKKRSLPAPEEFVNELYQRTEGWAAGIVLMLERQKPAMSIAELHHLTREEIFNYFAGELFDKTDWETKEFLLASAIMPSMTAEEARQLTCNPRSATILVSLNRNHFFTEKHFTEYPVYQYHPLFREFLMSRAEATLPPEQVHQLQRKASALLENSGRLEPAADLMCKTEDWSGLARLISSCAADFIAQGRTKTLEGWLDSFPHGYAELFPWLEYWLGVCRLPFNPAESRVHFERAFELFSKEEHSSNQLLAWAGISNCYYLAWSDFTPLDQWLPLLDELLQQQPVFPSAEIEGLVSNSIFGALLYRNPQHIKLVFWEDRLNSLLHSITDIRLRITIAINLANYYLWMGDLAKVSRLKNILQPTENARVVPTLTYLMWQNVEANYFWFSGDFTGCHKSVTNSLSTAMTSGVHLLDVFVISQGVYGALSEGDFAVAANFLRQMEARISPDMLLHTSHYHYLAGWNAALRNDFQLALDHTQEALSVTMKSGAIYPLALNHAALSLVLIALKRYPEASSSIAIARNIGQHMKNPLIETLCLLSESWLALKENDEPACLKALREAFSLTKTQGYVNLPWWLPHMMSSLCTKALDVGIELDYVQLLIRKRHLQADPLLNLSDNWPWPLKVYTLGRFELVMDGKPLRFSGKVQQKPLLLLKMLIALGGKGVVAEQVTDLLWPESDGDAAHSAFTSTLSRLRHILGIDGIIRYQNGMVTLSSHHCWVDAWAFERKVNEMFSQTNGKNDVIDSTTLIQQADQPLRYYQGHFLTGDTGQPWTLTRRERLRNKHLNLILLIGGQLENAQEWEKASTYYLRGLDVDESAEDFYRQLILCHGKLGRRAEALSVYKRCCNLFNNLLGIKPSPQITELARSIEMTK